jgi:predicted AlkP superfamily phosphohydrolase/phosphomutase
VVILGIDGLDPRRVRRGIEEERLPNFKKLANSGEFSPLDTTWVPLSPVAWSSLISGSNPGKHGIFDFLHRDPETYTPHLSIARQHDPPRTIEIGPYEFPVGSGHTEKGRKGPAFWRSSSRQHVSTTVIRCPTSFPPEPVRGKMLSGLGVPDLNGTQGSFTFFTSDENADSSSRGGDVQIVDHPKRASRTLSVTGPPNPFLCDHPRTEYEFQVECTGQGVHLESPDFNLTFEVGDWTDWQPTDFDFLGPFSAEGQIRFYLKSVRPEFELYCSPVNVSPENPVFPISYPENYAGELADEIDSYHTLGLTADTGMLKEGRVEDVAFLEQTNTVLEERIAMFKHELERFDDGIFNCVFDIPDRIQHMFWRFEDPDHAAYDADEHEQYGDVIGTLYERMDEVVGWALEQLNPNDDLVLCSDHGFSSFRRQVDLNTWLLNKGYLSLQDGGSPGDAGPMFHGVDWSRTKAYAIGLAGIYINVDGREKHGTVPSSEAPELAQKIADELPGLKDAQEEARPVAKAVPSKEVYHGSHTENAPDVLVGYREGYRVSWESAIGGMNGSVTSDNNNKWSGDHGLEPSRIPGTLLTNFSCDTKEGISLRDVIPGLFDRMGLNAPDEMDGRTDWV